MLNLADFSNRIKKILDFYGLTAAAFADKIGVQRSSISHILSGRNKPSLDFIIKITDNFSEVNLYWLLYGRGEFPQEEKQFQQKNDASALFQSKEIIKKEEHSIENKEKAIKKILILYTDGSFDAFEK